MNEINKQQIFQILKIVCFIRTRDKFSSRFPSSKKTWQQIKYRKLALISSTNDNHAVRYFFMFWKLYLGLSYLYKELSQLKKICVN